MGYKRDGGWTQENAIEFSRIHSNGSQRPNGTYRYGDRLYVQHVYRYLAPNDGSISNGGLIQVALVVVQL